MRDFDKRFKERQDNFYKRFKMAQALSALWFFFVAGIALALLSGVVYTVYRILLHYGIF